MRLLSYLALASGLIALAPGCLIENPSHVTDSTGAELGWECDNGSCRPVQNEYSPLPPECGDDAELLVGAGGLAILCAVGRADDGADVIHEATCRPLVCIDELDCPQWSSRTYSCIDGICQVEAAEGWRLDRVDLAALCLAAIPRHDTCAAAAEDPEVMERLSWVDAACDEDGDECASVPEACVPAEI